jgi:hypothetical protein
VQVHEEDPDQHEADPELRQGHAAQRGAAHQKVRPALAVHRRDHAERDADHDAEREPDQAELEGGRQPVRQIRGHALAGTAPPTS